MNKQLSSLAFSGLLLGCSLAHAQNYQALAYSGTAPYYLYDSGGWGSSSASGSYVLPDPPGIDISTASASLATGTIAEDIEFEYGNGSIYADLIDNGVVLTPGIAHFSFVSSMSVGGVSYSDPGASEGFEISGVVPGNSSEDYVAGFSQSVGDFKGTPQFNGSYFTPTSNGYQSLSSFQSVVNFNFKVYAGEQFSFEETAQASTGNLAGGGDATFAEIDPTWGLTLSGGATYSTASGILLPAAVTPEPSSLFALGLPLVGFIFKRRNRKSRS